MADEKKKQTKREGLTLDEIKDRYLPNRDLDSLNDPGPGPDNLDDTSQESLRELMETYRRLAKAGRI